MISYAPFWKLMKKEKMSQYRLIREGKLSAGVLNRLRNNQPVSTESIRQICLIFSCNVSDIMEFLLSGEREKNKEVLSVYSSIFCKIKGLIELYSIGPFSCSKL